MPSINIPLEEMANDVVVNHIKLLCQQAYEQGVQDGITKFSYPPVLTNKHLAEILQIAPPTVIKVTADPTFPRLSKIKARYPRDQVFEWIQANSMKLKGVV